MTVQPITRLIGEAFNNPLPAFAMPEPRTVRRRKLWELPPRWHCPLLGTCLPLVEMRRLAARAGLDEPGLSDYMLHSRVVAQCATRSEIAELIQRQLDQRHQAVVRRYGKAGDVEVVLRLWREALAAGDVAGALWAAWSHPAMDEDEGNRVYADIHMLSHQVGARASVPQQKIAAAERDNVRLRNELAASTRATREQQQLAADLGRRLGDAERRLADHARDAATLAQARAALEASAARELELDALTQQIHALERTNVVLQSRLDERGEELDSLHAELATVNAALEALQDVLQDPASAAEGEDGEPSALESLAGRNVVCVGGRTRLIDRYRRVVEASGGRFSHHDGGQEESLHRIDAIITGADIVLCQSGFVSHAAYWRIKESCKRRRLPCIFLKSAGVTTFVRSLEAASGGVASGS